MHVYKNIAAVQGELAKEGIAKDRNNQQQGYKFRGIDDVYNALAPVLSKHGLCILPRIISREMVERIAKNGNALFCVTVEAEFDFVSTEDGSKHTVRTFGEAMDSADKATNKAMSAAYKYAAFQSFCIPTEGDNDADSSTYDVAAKKSSLPPPPAKQAASSGISQGDSHPKAEKTAPASNTEVNPKAAEYHERIRGALRQIFNEDKAAALAYVETESRWIDKATGEVKAAGVKDYRKLSEGRAKVLCHKLDAELKKRQIEVPAQTVTCDICGADKPSGGECPSCPF
ncbi:MAG: ERF family protein [Trichlorobacter sp.]|jgi:hypothetical protein|nr:ERF family protein [Trichlorobacter sp.]